MTALMTLLARFRLLAWRRARIDDDARLRPLLVRLDPGLRRQG